jgi:hypothetical protein
VYPKVDVVHWPHTDWAGRPIRQQNMPLLEELNWDPYDPASIRKYYGQGFDQAPLGPSGAQSEQWVRQPEGPRIPYAEPPPAHMLPPRGPAPPPCDPHQPSQYTRPAQATPAPPPPAREDSTARSQAAKHVKLPEYDGSTEVENFFVRFEIACQALDVGEDKMLKAYLLGRLKGAALAWSQGLQGRLVAMTYDEMKDGLMGHFKGEATGAARKLLNLT